MAEITVIRNGRLLSDRLEAGQLADVLVQQGHIKDVFQPGTPVADVAIEIDASNCLVMPGLINGHTHAHGALGRGQVDDCVSLEGFLAQSAAMNGARTLQDIGLSARLSAVEQLRHGCTASFDMSMQMPLPTLDGLVAVGSAYRDVGMRAVVAPMIADKSLYQAYPELLDSFPQQVRATVASLPMPSAAALAKACRDAQAQWPFDRRLIQLGIAPTIPQHCSDELLLECARISEEFNVPFQTHMAESKLQAFFGRKHNGESPVCRLARLGCLSERTSLAHSVWLDEEDLALLAKHQTTVIHNPLSNLRLGSGIAPLRRLLDAGVRVGMGTDASNTSDGQNMFEAIRMASLLTRVASPDWDKWVTAQDALALAMSGGASALGCGLKLGKVLPGYCADLLMLDLTQTHFVPLRNVLRQLVLAQGNAGIRRVMVNGKLVLENDTVLGLDEAQLNHAAQTAADRLDTATASARSSVAELQPWLKRFCEQAGNQSPFNQFQML